MKWNTKVLHVQAIFLPNIEHKLEKMAAKGWMLVEVFQYTMVFKACEPQFIRFNILLNPENEKVKGETGPIGELESLCADAGWHFHSRYGSIILFTSPDPTISAIHTDGPILFNSVKKQIERILKKEFFWLGVYLGLMIYLLMNMSYKDATNWLIAGIALSTILVILNFIMSFVPQVIWWGMNRKKSDNSLFAFSDTIYDTLSVIFWLQGIIVIILVFMGGLLQPVPGINFMPVLIPIIGLSPLLIKSWIRESENKLRVPSEIAWIIAVSVGISIFLSFGGITLFTGDLFSGKQAIRLSDVSDTTSIVGPLDNATSIGLLAMKAVDTSETTSEGSVNTLILGFYSEDEAATYWEHRLDDLTLGDSIQKSWGIEGYAFDDQKGIILRNGKEIIEIDAEIDISNPIYIDRMKTRLGLQEGK
jgi:hypothetical protein